MTFEQWMNRPHYLALCCTTSQARRLFGTFGVAFRFRCLPKYRDGKARQQRKAVADAIRAARANGRIDLSPWHYPNGSALSKTGVAVRCDLAAELETFTQ